jgi:hypothetical protein
MSDKRIFNPNPTGIILFFLLICVIAGFAGCIYFAQQGSSSMATTTLCPGSNMTTGSVTNSGANGGAAGCGVFGGMALLALVQVYISKTS